MFDSNTSRGTILPYVASSRTAFLLIIYPHTVLHYTTLHYTTLHHTALHYTTLHYTIPHYTTLHCTTLHYTALHCTPLHYITLHYTTLHCSVLYVFSSLFLCAYLQNGCLLLLIEAFQGFLALCGRFRGLADEALSTHTCRWVNE